MDYIIIILCRAVVEDVITVGLKCVLEKTGAPYVMTFGRIKMQVLHADSLVSRSMVSC